MEKKDYTTKAEVEIAGKKVAVGEVVSLTDEEAKTLLEEGKIEAKA